MLNSVHVSILEKKIFPDSSYVFVTNAQTGQKNMSSSIISSIRKVEAWYGGSESNSQVVDALTFTQFVEYVKIGNPILGLNFLKILFLELKVTKLHFYQLKVT